MDDSEQRQLEIESLESIFPDLLKYQTERQLTFEFERSITLTISLPDDYPTSSPPLFELSGPYFTADERLSLQNQLNNVYLENMGFPIIFQWVTVIQDYIRDTEDAQSSTDNENAPEEVSRNEEVIEDDMNIQHGEVFHDRKSFFQAHLAAISSKEDVDKVMQILKSNSKIRRATHNILAYRYVALKDGKEIKYHDCEDDGETGASSKMLELLERMKATNVMVVVTRWYGGIHLGPDRFRHINNLTRQILVDNNYGSNNKK